MSFWQSIGRMANPFKATETISRPLNSALNEIPGVGHAIAQVTTAPTMGASKALNRYGIQNESQLGGYMAHQLPGKLGDVAGDAADLGTHLNGSNTYQQDKQEKLDKFNNDPSNFLGAGSSPGMPNPNGLIPGPYQLQTNMFDPFSGNNGMQPGQIYQLPPWQK